MSVHGKAPGRYARIRCRPSQRVGMNTELALKQAVAVCLKPCKGWRPAPCTPQRLKHSGKMNVTPGKVGSNHRRLGQSDQALTHLAGTRQHPMLPTCGIGRITVGEAIKRAIGHSSRPTMERDDRGMTNEKKSEISLFL